MAVMETRCPHCGSKTPTLLPTFTVVPSVVHFRGKSCAVTPMHVDILEILLDAFPRAVPLTELAQLWDQAPKPPTDIESTLSVQISYLRRRLALGKMGFGILARRGWQPRSGYALVIFDPITP